MILKRLIVPVKLTACALVLGFISMALSNAADAQERKVNDPSGLTKYVKVKLEADLSHLSENQRKMIVLLIEASEQMDVAFWRQAYGNREKLKMPDIGSKQLNHALKQHTEINYGPWERLQENRPFLSDVPEKPKGANFYPKKMTKE